MKLNQTPEKLKEILVNEALWNLTDKPVTSTTFERIRLFHEADVKFAELPQQLKYGRGLNYVLENCQVPVDENDLILGRVPEKVLTDEEEEFFNSVRGNSARPGWVTDGGHRSWWWWDLVEYGLPGLRQRAVESLEKHRAKGSDENRLRFLEGAILVYDALLKYTKRYADAARAMGLDEAADVCEEMLKHEPRTFREGLQTYWMVQVVYCGYLAANPTLTYGRMDLALEKLYNDDIAAGRLTADDARLLVLDYYCKNNLINGRGEHQMSGSDPTKSTGWDRNLCYDAPQYLLIGGRRPDGSYLNGEITKIFAEMIVPRFKNPVIEVRYAPNMQNECPEFWRIVCDKMRQSSSMMVYSEADNIASYLRSGADPEDAFAFEHFGCNHPTLAGIDNLYTYGGTTVLIPYMDGLRKWVEEGFEPTSTEDLYKLGDDIIRRHATKIITDLRNRFLYNMEHPSCHLEMTDCFYRDSIPNGTSYWGYGAKYHTVMIGYCSYASLIDVITAIDELVIKQKKMTFAHLMKAVEADYEGYPVELALCKKQPKLGSDDPIANQHAHDVLLRFTDIVNGLAEEILPKIGEYELPDDLTVIPRPLVRHSMESDNGHLYGQKMGATPDGRRAGVPLAQNCAPAVGSSCNGLTARLSSMASLPFDRITAGAQNISIQPRAFAGEEGLDKLASIIGGYFDMGGLQVQITAVDVNLLREAQLNPEAHKDLTVRITGYSAVFVDMVKRAQDDIIRREEMTE